MNGATNAGRREPEITAVLIAPDRALATEFLATLPHSRSFQVLADLKSYPPTQTIEMRVRQLRPHVVLLDLATDLEAAVGLIRQLATLDPPVQVVGLHRANDSQAILQSLRAGAVEFLHAPFELATQREAVARLRRLILPDTPGQAAAGKVIAVASSKPGSGASTMATQMAFALQRLTGKRVLLADCDLTGGTIGFYLKLNHSYSLVDALRHVERLDPALWNSLAVHHSGIDILPAPAMPYAEPLDPARLKALTDQARLVFDWIVLDLPAVASQTSLMAVAECDRAYVVSTAELPSLHVTRKAMALIQQLGFPKERFHVLVNRVDRNDEMSAADMEKLFGCPVHARLPNDYFALHRVVTLGQPLGTDCELGRSIENIARVLCKSMGAAAAPAASPAASGSDGRVRDARPALTQA
ncbi:MAG: P-loop NTPase [Acidobacteriota bacterium]